MDVAVIVVRPFHSFQVGDVVIDPKQIQALANDERSHSVVRSIGFPHPAAASEEIS